MTQSVSYRKEGDIGVITIDNPPVNALSQHVRHGLHDTFSAAQDDETVAIVLICAGRTFIAGADISEFGKPMQPPNFLDTLSAMENMPKPVVAAIHGTALGGGLETALCCHYRVACNSARVGLPEVLLGLLPGAGGTQRLPRLIGAEAAVEAISTGRQIGAKAAKEIGIIDHLVADDQLLEGAIAFARELVATKAPLNKVRDRAEKVSDVDLSIFDRARAELARSRRGFEAPLRCVDSVEAACTLPFDAGMARERELFQALHDGVQSAAQRHIFFAERAASKIDDMPAEIKPQPINSVGVIGAGTMGGGIAMNFANVGIPVVLLEVEQANLDRGLEVVQSNYQRTVAKGRLSAEQADTRMGLISPTTDYADLAEVDMVIEAVYENMEIKKTVFAQLDAVTKADCILATNTSTLDVDEIAEVTQRPEKVIGTHFFSPANVMKLLEIVRGAKTSHETLATTMAVTKAIKKVGVVVGVCDGFVGNRMIHRYLEQAQFMLEEGALPHQVDDPIYQLGFAMGPLTMSDLAGLDVGWRIRQGKGLPASLPAGQRYCEIADRICEMNRFGQKTGGGFYNYNAETRARERAPEIEQLVAAYSEEKGISRRTIDSAEVIERLMYALINEGAWILEEGIAQRASDIDVIYVYGYGVPSYLGGPMFYANQVGLDTVYNKVCEFAEQDPASWKPAALLKRLAESGGQFS